MKKAKETGIGWVACHGKIAWILSCIFILISDKPTNSGNVINCIIHQFY